MPPIFVPTPLVAGELVLRPWEPADAPVIAEAASDPDVAVWTPMAVVVGDAATALEWCEARADWSEGTHASWAVTIGGDVAGGISLFKLDHDQLTAEAGYFVLPAWRRHRVASRALATAARFGFGPLGMSRIELFHAVENVASCGVALSAGFRQEGVHRQSFRYGDGGYRDEHCHARLASDGRL